MVGPDYTAPFLDEREEGVEGFVRSPFGTRRLAAVLSAAGVIIVTALGAAVMDHAARAARVRRISPVLLGTDAHAAIRTPAAEQPHAATPAPAH